jgi:beta-glucosidase
MAAANEAAWADKTATPDARAAALVAAMSQDEKLQLVASNMPILMKHRPAEAVLGAGYVAGIPRLGIPAIEETDASLGVANLMNARHNDEATALPSTLALAAAWDTTLAEQAGAMIGAEARAKRFTVMLAGGVNLTRDPRGGRSFEYAGEDPLLAGMTAGAEVRGIQSNHIVSTVKHFALNDQESGRQLYDARIGEAAARESDLLAFEIAIEQGRPGAVMSAYNKVNGDWTSENRWLLTNVLKHDWHFPGWVMSDWGNVHSTVQAANAGLDQQSGQSFDPQPFFGAPLAAALQSGAVPPTRLDDMVRRILRSLIAAGVYDTPPSAAAPIDYAAHAHIAQRAEERGIVLLKNANALLPLAADTPSIAVIGGHADSGVLSGGGSSEVRPAGGWAKIAGNQHRGPFGPFMYDPSSPLAALRAEWPHAAIEFDDGTDPARAASRAARAKVAILFAAQYRSEGADVPTLALQDGQEALIAAVAAANPHCVVVLESGGPVTMPWLGHVGAVIEAWYPGQAGGQAIARIISGAVNPSGHLPLSFPASEAQLPRPVLDGLAVAQANPAFALVAANNFPPFDVDYRREAANVGYRWYAARHLVPLFPFGFGLTYTRFTYTGFSVTGGGTVTARLTVRNTGPRAGNAVPQIYALIPGEGGAVPHLVGWQNISLAPGESRSVTIKADPRLLARFDARQGKWHIQAGDILLYAGENVTDARMKAKAALIASDQAP